MYHPNANKAAAQHSASSATERVTEWFFNNDTEKGLIQQMEWLHRKLDFSDHYLASLADVSESEYYKWKYGDGRLADSAKETLRNLWHAILHILSLFNFELWRIQDLIDHKAAPNEVKIGRRHPSAPPWLGGTFRNYILEQRACGIDAVTRWVESIRFDDGFNEKSEEEMIFE